MNLSFQILILPHLCLMSLILTLKNRTLHLSMVQFSMISCLSESLCSVLIERLGIDELHSHELSIRNSSYLCVLVDNERRTVWDILDSRNKMSLSLFFSNIPREERLRVKYVTIDMWEPYKDVARTYFPNCVIAVDSFHVIKHLTQGFERLRIDLMNMSPYGSNAYYMLKKWSHLLTKDSVYLDNDKVYNSRFKCKLNRRDLREMIFKTFPELSKAYSLKELYRNMNKDCSYDDRKLSNSFTENVNGKLRTYLAVSRGISNFNRFRKRVIYSLSKDVQYSLNNSLHSDSVPKRKRGTYKKNRE